MSKPMCAATASRPAINDPNHVVTIRCFRRDGHPGLHFDAVQGDWADGDTEMRPYSVRDHILRAMDPATEDTQRVYERLLDEFQRAAVRTATQATGQLNKANTAAIRTALAEIPAECRYHGKNLEELASQYFSIVAPRPCCDTGRSSLLRRKAEAAVKRIEEQQ